MVEFKKAERKQARLRLAITGPSGSGKTYSALQIASGMGGKIAVIDTENHSASLYADEFEFDCVEIDAPYTVDKYLEALEAAQLAGYEVIVCDSITHEWQGEGGLLQKKSALDARGGNQYTNWAGPTKEHERFKAALLGCKSHLIVTMRSKEEYVMTQNEHGKSLPKKVGMAPIQREDMNYEFSLVLDMGMDHKALASKSRISGFTADPFIPTKETGKKLVGWLTQGTKEPEVYPGDHAWAEAAKLKLEGFTGGNLHEAELLLSGLTKGRLRISELGMINKEQRDWLDGKMANLKEVTK